MTACALVHQIFQVIKQTKCLCGEVSSKRENQTYSLKVAVSGSSVITSCSASTLMLMIPQNLSWITLKNDCSGKNVIQRTNTAFQHSENHVVSNDNTVTERCFRVSSQACEQGCHGESFSSQNQRE